MAVTMGSAAVATVAVTVAAIVTARRKVRLTPGTELSELVSLLTDRAVVV